MNVMKPKIKETKTKSVDEFFNKLRMCDASWRGSSGEENSWVYRGQYEPESKDLLPTALRVNLGLRSKKFQNNLLNEKLPNGNDIKSCSKNIANNFKSQVDSVSNLTRILEQSLIETLLLKRYIDTCNKSALYIQDHQAYLEVHSTGSCETKRVKYEEWVSRLENNLESWIAIHERQNLQGNQMRCMPFVMYENYSSLALAQHSGLPTRLLDWSYNSLVAAFFSAYKAVENKHDGFLSVYCLDTQYTDSNLNGSLKIHENFKHSDLEFLHVQRGLFTEMEGADYFYLQNGKWPSLDKHIELYDKAFKSRDLYNLKKITLPAKFSKDVLKNLKIEGITKSTLMPTYFHCAESVLGL